MTPEDVSAEPRLVCEERDEFVVEGLMLEDEDAADAPRSTMLSCSTGTFHVARYQCVILGCEFVVRGALTTTFPNDPVPSTSCSTYCFFLLADGGCGSTFWETRESIDGQ